MRFGKHAAMRIFKPLAAPGRGRYDRAWTIQSDPSTLPPSRTRAASPKTRLPKAAPKKAAAKPAPKNARRNRRSAEDIRPKIVQAAAEEFKRRGYTGATTAAIARKAQVTEAQLFRYFASKSNLFRETVFEPLDRHLQNFIQEHLGSAGTGRDLTGNTDLYTSELQRFIRDNSRMLTSLVMVQTYDAGTEHGLGRIDSLNRYFEHGAAAMRSRFKGKPPVAPELMVRLAFVLVLGSGMFREWLFPKGLAGEAEIEAAINAFVRKGLSVNG